MRLVDRLHKVEIFFWKYSVHVMKNPPSIRWLFLFSVGVLLAGGIGIFQIATRSHPDHSRSEESVIDAPIQTATALRFTKIQPTEYVQTNLLIVLVDKLFSEKPNLRGVWLAGRASSVPQVVFLPLYPSSSSTETALGTELFTMDQDGQLSPDFLEFLRSKEVWWNHYVVLDEAALADLVALTDGIFVNGKPLNSSQVIAVLPEAGDAPEAALKAQALIASELCRYAPELLRNTDPEILWGLLTHRMRSDFKLDSIQSAQEAFLMTESSPTCEFPTFREITYRTGMD